MKNLAKTLMLGLFVSFFAMQSLASDNLTRIPTVTFLVKQYSELENNLQQAIVNNNTKALNDILVADFEERDGSNPNNPIPKEVWIKKMVSQQHSIHQMQQIAVRDFGNNIRIISFLLIEKVNNETLFVVDVWQKNEKNDQLLVRYSTTPKKILKTTITKKY